MSSWLLEGPDEWLEDRGLTHGLGLFETMLVTDGVILGSRMHFSRMAAGCSRLGIGVPDWELVEETVAANAPSLGSRRVRARLMRTSGCGELAQAAGVGESTVLKMEPWVEPPSELRVATAPWIRDERSPLAGVKCTSYADPLMALRFARSLDRADELLFANSKGDWVEGTTSNGFAVIRGELVTPSLDSGCLPGTMRARVLGWASELGMPCRERPVAMAELRYSSEIFLTSAIRGVISVANFDGRSLPRGEATEVLFQRWKRVVALSEV